MFRVLALIPATGISSSASVALSAIAASLIVALAVRHSPMRVKSFRKFVGRRFGSWRELEASQRRLLEQQFQLDTTFENMAHGICIFGADKRLIVCNKHYAEMYRLPAELTKPGTPHDAIIAHRTRNGIFADETDARAAYNKDGAIGQFLANQTNCRIKKLADGRLIRVTREPAGGGWVATHEDVTLNQQREDSFRLLFEDNPVPMWVVAWDDLRFLAVNDAAIDHYGFSRDQFMAMTARDIQSIGDREPFLTSAQNVFSDGRVGSRETQHTTAAGNTIDVLVYSRALVYQGCNARLAAIHDITKAKRAEAELRDTKKFLDAVVEHVPLPIVVKDVSGTPAGAMDGRFTLFNRAYEALTGESREQLIGRTTHQIFPKQRADLVVQADNEALQSADAVVTSEHSIDTINNGTRLVTAKKTAIRDDDGRPRFLLTVVDDVTEARRAERRISYLAHTDALTGLPNRATFTERLVAELEVASERGEQFALLCLDLDHFKEANDSFGHAFGDTLLREVAGRMRMAAAGAFLARVGGDEFVLIVSGGNLPDAATAVAERLLREVGGELEIEGRHVTIDATIGAAVYPKDGADPETLMINADVALYRAKAAARGTVVFYEAEMGEIERERLALQTDLRSALEKNELFLHYQPQQTINGKTIGFEALVRWQCPKRGLVLPGTFIPLAEECGLVVRLDEWVLREACFEAVRWPEPLTIAVNISPSQFLAGDFPGYVHAVLLETGLPASRLELEVTEGVLIHDFSRAISILCRLKALGVRIALDDFGTGYSSMSYLHAFPFDKIKIDQGFVADVEHNHRTMDIVRAVITLGHSLGVSVLAEGVETTSQWEFLKSVNCDEVQGYLLGRPSLMSDYAELVGLTSTGECRAAV